jgi:hypothetical protein
MGQYPAQTLFIANIAEPLFDLWEGSKLRDRIKFREIVIGFVPDYESGNMDVLVAFISLAQIDLPSLIRDWFPGVDPSVMDISGNQVFKVECFDQWMGPISDATETYFAQDNDLLLIATSKNAISEWWSDSPRIGGTPGFAGFSAELPGNGVPVGYGSAGVAKWLISGEEDDSHLSNICRILYDYTDDVGIYQIIRSDGMQFEAISKSDLSIPVEIAILASLSWQSGNGQDLKEQKVNRRKIFKDSSGGKKSRNVMRGKRFRVEQ